MIKNIILAADFKYNSQLMTTIKSICYHNNNITFYLINKDFPIEWFNHINLFLSEIGCSIYDVKILNNDINSYKTLGHINSDTTYFRYFISEFLDEEKALYLDSDLIITNSLDELFKINLDGVFIAAVPDILVKHLYQEYNFNAGVMLINTTLWKQYNINQLALDLSNQYINELRDSDQSVLNILFENHWLELDKQFNYQIGIDSLGVPELIEDLGDQIPTIIHFNSQIKPWLPDVQHRFKALYWCYFGLEWQQIIQRHQ